jgi:glycosyltransferase involved in cell wall biosynthesis
MATTEETKKQMQALGCCKVSVFPQVGLPAHEIHRLGSFSLREENPFRLISIGRLLHWKGFELGLKAFAQFCQKFPASEYWLVGEGPERKRLEGLAHELGLAERITFWGAIPRSQALEKLSDCDILLHPSLHDSNPWACVEAMAAGRPVICLNLGGLALQVTEETGFKIPAISPKQTVRDLAIALVRLADDPALRSRMAEMGRQRVEKYFAWDKKGDLLMEFYSGTSRV